MSSFEIAMSIIGTLVTILGAIGTFFLSHLIKTLDTIQDDTNGIKVEIGKIVTTQLTHEQKFDSQDRRLEKIEEKIYV